MAVPALDPGRLCAAHSPRRAFPARYASTDPLLPNSGTFTDGQAESPRWLIEQGEYNHAFELVKKLHFTGKNEEFVRNEFHEMRDQILIEKENTVRSYKEAFAKPSWRKRIFLACGIWVGVSLTGITSVNFYCKCPLREQHIQTKSPVRLTLYPQ